MERRREDFGKESSVSSRKMNISGDSHSVYCNDSTHPTAIDSFPSFCSVHIIIRVLEVLKHAPETVMGCVCFGGPGT